MYHYTFPEIRAIDDVLPHIVGRPEFIIAERPYGKIINYVVAMADTFDMTGPDDLGGALRRECRGLKFYPDGSIAARPFFKFFNVGERVETQPHLLDFGSDHTVMEKCDGSMVHAMKVNDGIRWMTKMGITEVSSLVEAYVSVNPRYEKFASACIDRGLTAIFEYVGPYNKVVLDYKVESMVLLAVRETISGKFLEIHR
jgi:RNA ligase